MDDTCTQPYTFTTMPEGITVYAKWRQIQYRAFLHSNALLENGDYDDTLFWGSDSQEMSFRVSYGGKISVPRGTKVVVFIIPTNLNLYSLCYVSPV